MVDQDRQVWGDMLAHLRNCHPAVCRQWFEELEPCGVAGGTMQLRARSVVHRDYLRRECADPFNDAARSVTGRLIAVRFLGPDEAAQVAPPPPRRATIIDAPKPALGIEVKPAQEPVTTQNGHAANGTGTNGTGSNGLGSNGVAPSILEPRVPLEPRRPTEPRLIVTSHSRNTPTRYDSLVVNPDYCFENFVVGPGNRMAHAAAMAIAANPGRVYNPFFVHAGVGLGKTHLLQAICLRIAEANPNAVMYYTSCEGFVTQFFESVQNGEMAEFRHRFRDVDVLVIDDIHFLAKRESSQEEFFNTFNALYQANKQIILSCDAPPEDIPDLEDRLVSRFKWGLVTRIEPPIFETRVAILKSKAAIRGLSLPDDVACFIAGRLNTNIRELEGAVVKLHIQSTVEQRPIDMSLAKEALGDSIPEPKGEPTLQAIIGAVTEFYGVRLTDLQSKGRQRSIALPRQVCMFLARRCTRHSLEEIGGFFGGRDHTTVMHAVETVEGKRKLDSEFDLVVRTLEDRIRAPKAA